MGGKLERKREVSGQTGEDAVDNESHSACSATCDRHAPISDMLFLKVNLLR